MAVFLNRSKSLNRSLGCRHVCKVRNLALNSCLSDVAVVAHTLSVQRSIDNDVYLSVCNLIQDVRTALINLSYLLGRKSCSYHNVACSSCSHQLEAALVEAVGYLDELCLVLVVDA